MTPELAFTLGLDFVTVVLIFINGWLMKGNWQLRQALMEAMAETMTRLRTMQEVNARNLEEIYRHITPSDEHRPLQ